MTQKYTNMYDAFLAHYSPTPPAADAAPDPEAERDEACRAGELSGGALGRAVAGAMHDKQRRDGGKK